MPKTYREAAAFVLPVGHGQQVGPIVLHLKIFIRKGSTVNRLASFAVAVRDIATCVDENQSRECENLHIYCNRCILILIKT